MKQRLHTKVLALFLILLLMGALSVLVPSITEPKTTTETPSEVQELTEATPAQEAVTIQRPLR